MKKRVSQKYHNQFIWCVLMIVIMFAAAVLWGCSATQQDIDEQSAGGTVDDHEKNQTSAQETAKETIKETANSERAANGVTFLAEPEQAKLQNLLDLIDVQLSEQSKQAIQFFSWKSTAVALENGTENQCYSPLSLFVALSMCTELTNGNARSQLLDVLGRSNIDELRQTHEILNDILNMYQSGMESSADEEYLAQIRLSNSYWLNQQILSKNPTNSVNQQTLDQLVQYYKASAGMGVFGNQQTDTEIGKWIYEQTEGMLNPQLQTNAEDFLILINTLYYHAQWYDQFIENENIKDSFILDDGSAKDVTYMQKQKSTAYLENDNWQAIYLPLYAGNMILALPNEGITPEDLLNSKDCFDQLITMPSNDTEVNYRNVHYQIPKFTFSDEMDLVDAVKKMDITEIFTDKADFSPLTDLPIMISKIMQGSKVSIDEKGCSASAYTAMFAAGAAFEEEQTLIEFVLNRPFLFIIEYQGMPLFVGTVHQPVIEE